MIAPKVALPNEVFGLLTVLEEAEPERVPSKVHRGGSQTYRRVRVRCRCGAEKVVRVASLTKGYATSCGEGRCWHLARRSWVPSDISVRKRKRGGPDLRKAGPFGHGRQGNRGS